MTTVWVLSEESPFTESAESGGCVRGVYATAEAALFALAAEQIGEHAVAEITWRARHAHSYEGWGHGDEIYFLVRWDVQDLASLRESLAAWYEGHGHSTPPDPYLTITTAELLARLGEVPTEDLAP